MKVLIVVDMQNDFIDGSIGTKGYVYFLIFVLSLLHQSLFDFD